MIQCVRDPMTAAPSIVREDRHAPRSYEFRQTQIRELTGVDLDELPSELDRAVGSLCLWNNVIRDQSPDHVFRIEDGYEGLVSFLKSCGFGLSNHGVDLSPTNSDKMYRGVRYNKPEVDATVWSGLSDRVRALLQDYCDRYGYECPSTF